MLISGKSYECAARVKNSEITELNWLQQLHRMTNSIQENTFNYIVHKQKCGKI
jgi:hypothetical protein